jgi:hypothetical protein
MFHDFDFNFNLKPDALIQPDHRSLPRRTTAAAKTKNRIRALQNYSATSGKSTSHAA